MMRKLAALAALLVMVLVQVSVPETAGADPVPPGGPKIEIKNNDSGHTDDGNGPGPVDHYDPPVSKYMYMSYYLTPLELSYHFKCHPADTQDTRIWIGVIFRYVRADFVSLAIHGPYTTSCIFGPEEDVFTVECVDRMVANVNGPTQTSGSIHEETVWSEWHSDKSNPAKCAGKVNQSVSLKLNTMGQFKIVSVASKISCLLHDYKGVTPNKIDPASCETEYTVAPVENKVQVWCNSWSQDWTTGNPHSFTLAECMQPDDVESWCNEPGVTMGWDALQSTPAAPRIFTVLDDGKRHLAKWGPTTLTGDVRHVDNQQTWLTVEASGTPKSREGAQGADNQPFRAPAERIDGDDASTGNVLQWYAPSLPGQPWTMSRSVSFDAEFRLPTVTITSMDLTTGKVAPVRGDDLWPAAHGACQSVPLKVMVSRARNFR